MSAENKKVRCPVPTCKRWLDDSQRGAINESLLGAGLIGFETKAEIMRALEDSFFIVGTDILSECVSPARKKKISKKDRKEGKKFKTVHGSADLKKLSEVREMLEILKDMMLAVSSIPCRAPLSTAAGIPDELTDDDLEELTKPTT